MLIAADGLECLGLAERERPDAIFADVAMPDLTGLELAETVRGRPDLTPIAVVLVSASAQRAQLEEGFRHSDPSTPEPRLQPSGELLVVIASSSIPTVD